MIAKLKGAARPSEMRPLVFDVKGAAREMDRMRPLRTLIFTLPLCLAVGPALAEPKQRIVFRVDAANTKYTQQYAIDVGDIPGHQVRLFEIRRTYSSDAPAINGTKIVESWTRGVTDYINNNGSATTYWIYVLENGDKFFTRGSVVAVQGPGEGKLTATTVGPIMGGTGKLVGIQGMARTMTLADPKAGVGETQVEIEYFLPQ
jgi:hypothetical protein